MICSDAPKLLKMRREIAAGDMSPTVIKSMVEVIDLIRWNHEEMNNECDCFQKARRMADRVKAA